MLRVSLSTTGRVPPCVDMCGGKALASPSPASVARSASRAWQRGRRPHPLPPWPAARVDAGWIRETERAVMGGGSDGGSCPSRAPQPHPRPFPLSPAAAREPPLPLRSTARGPAPAHHPRRPGSQAKQLEYEYKRNGPLPSARGPVGAAARWLPRPGHVRDTSGTMPRRSAVSRAGCLGRRRTLRQRSPTALPLQPSPPRRPPAPSPLRQRGWKLRPRPRGQRRLR